MSVNTLRSIFSSLLMVPFAFCMVTFASCQQIPPEYKEFLELPAEQQREKLRTFPIDKQIDYYLAGQRYIHPPLGLYDVIASEGKDAVPHLVKKLRGEKQESQQVDLMYVFDHMHSFHYNLKDEKEVIELLKEVVTKMKMPQHKARAARVLGDILEDRPPDLERFKRSNPKAFPNSNQ